MSHKAIQQEVQVKELISLSSDNGPSTSAKEARLSQRHIRLNMVNTKGPTAGLNQSTLIEDATTYYYITHTATICTLWLRKALRCERTKHKV